MSVLIHEQGGRGIIPQATGRLLRIKSELAAGRQKPRKRCVQTVRYTELSRRGSRIFGANSACLSTNRVGDDNLLSDHRYLRQYRGTSARR